MDFKELETAVADVDGYCISLTVLKNGELHHYLYTSKFPLADLIPSIAEVKKLAENKVLEGMGNAKDTE